MTKLLQTAISELNKLPDAQQDAMAAFILEELADEHRWQESFARSQDKLSLLAEKVRSEIASGRTHSVEIDQL